MKAPEGLEGRTGMEARRFLKGFTATELLERNVLVRNGNELILKETSVTPLRELMRQQMVLLLESHTLKRGGGYWHWWITETNHQNPNSGNAPGVGNVFTGQNENINPHWQSSP